MHSTDSKHVDVADFSTGASVGLSNITILGGAIANLVFNAPRRHGLKDAPLIDWDLIMVMEPVTILGTILGGCLNKASLQEVLCCHSSFACRTSANNACLVYHG